MKKINALSDGEEKNKLNITWRRLVIDGKTCDRCGSTEKELEKAVGILKKTVSPLNIDIELKKEELSKEQFEEDPLKSNEIYINHRPLEEYLSASTGASPCCSVCGPNDCRTVEYKGKTLEKIPASMIVEAGLMAVANS